jgi:hypothetical protein
VIMTSAGGMNFSLMVICGVMHQGEYTYNLCAGQACRGTL